MKEALSPIGTRSTMRWRRWRASPCHVWLRLLGLADDDVGIFNVATPSGHRRRGYGGAITAHAVHAAFADGADLAWLQTTEIGSWISGYFGSGKSHLAKVLALLAENRALQGHTAAKRFEGRVPPTAPHRDSILRSLGRLDQCSTRVLAFNLNTLVDSRTTPLPRLLLSQYYQSRGYSSNLLVARAVEQELEGRGQLEAFHSAVARRAGVVEAAKVRIAKGVSNPKIASAPSSTARRTMPAFLSPSGSTP